MVKKMGKEGEAPLFKQKNSGGQGFSRKGLIEDYRQYKFLGSIEFDISQS